MDPVEISVTVVGDDPRAARLGRSIFDSLKEQFGTLPFVIRVKTIDDNGTAKATYTNEGKRR